MPTWEVRASTELPIVARDEWDGDAALARVLDFFRDDDGSVNANLAPRGFLLYDADSDGDNQEDYKFPFADIVDGELVAVTRGIEVADSFLQDAAVDGRTQGEMADVIEEYRRRADDLVDPEGASADPYSVPAKADPEDLGTGDRVRWSASGGTAFGMVDAKETNGPIEAQPEGPTMEGTPDDPAFLVTVMEEGEDGWTEQEQDGTVVKTVHRAGALTMIDTFPQRSSRNGMPHAKRMATDASTLAHDNLGCEEKDLPYETFAAGGGRTKDVDTDSRVVTGYYSSWDAIDSDNERFVPGAFQKSIEKDGPGAENQRIKHLYQHDVRGLVGKPRVLREDDFGLYFETEIVDTALGNDVLRMYEADLFEHSVGFMRREQDRRDDGVTEILEADLMEGSSVTWGANPNTPFQGFKSVTDFADHLAEKARRLRTLLESNPETLDADRIALGLRQLEASLAVIDNVEGGAKQREKEGISFPLSLFEGDEGESEVVDLSDTGTFF